MYKSKLLELFSALSSSEQRALGKWVHSPYHNQREDVQLLYEYLYQERNLVDRASLQKEKVFEAVYPQQNFDADQLDYCMSFLLKLLEQFLISENLNRDPIERQLRLLEEYRRLQLDKHFGQTWNYTQKLQNKQPLRDSSYYRRAFVLELERYSHSIAEQRSSPKNLQAMANSLDLYYFSERLKQSCLMLAHRAVYKTDYDMGPTEQLLIYLNSKPALIEDNPTLGLYFHYYNTLTASDIETSKAGFQQFKRLFMGQLAQLPKSEVHDLYVFAINYCIRRLNSGDLAFGQEVFGFYRLGLEQNILLEHGQLSAATFKNIAKMALKLDEFDWAAQFIEYYSPKLDSKQRAAYTHYAKGELLFRKKAYKEAMLELQEIEHGDIFMNIDARVILLKIYYELKEQEVFESMLNSLKTYLRRKEQLGYHRENYSNIIRIANKLLQVNPFDKKELTKLQKEIEETKVLSERAWFLEQVEQIRNSR